LADFTVDSAAFDNWASTLQNSVEYTSQAKTNLAEMQSAASALSKEFASLSVGGDLMNQLKELQNAFSTISGDISNFSSALSNMSLGSTLAKELQQIKTTLETIQKHNTKGAEDKKKQEESQKKLEKILKEQLKQTASWILGLAGVQFSLVGILKLFLEIANENKKITAYSKQISAQMGGPFVANAKASKSTIFEMRDAFAMNFDEIGKNLNALAQTGMEMDTLRKSAVELHANQVAGGTSAQQQAESINRMMTEFNMAGDRARDYNTVLQKTGKTIDGLSISQVADDWSQMGDSVRGFNTDLLGTVSLYNVLVRKGGALGLGEVPQEFKRDLAKTAARFGQNMEDGWKVFLGEGETAIDKLFDFEKQEPGEKLARAIEGAQKLAGQSGVSMNEAMFKMRKIFAAMGMDESTVARSLASATVSGEINADKLRAELKKAQDEAKKELEDTKKSRAAMINLGSTIARGIKSYEELLNQWVKNSLRPLVTEIVQAINKLVEALTAKEMKELGKAPGQIKEGMAHRTNVKQREAAWEATSQYRHSGEHRFEAPTANFLKAMEESPKFAELEKALPKALDPSSKQNVVMGLFVEAVRAVGDQNIHTIEDLDFVKTELERLLKDDRARRAIQKAVAHISTEYNNNTAAL
jgi:hypothetical protein